MNSLTSPVTAHASAPASAASLLEDPVLIRRRWMILVLLFLSTVINYIDRQALSVLMPSLRAELALSSADYGAITTGFMLAYTVSQLLSGALIDRVGTRIGFALAMMAWSAAAMGHALAGSALALLGLRVALGIGEAGAWPAGAKAVAEWFPAQRRAFAMGVFDGGSAVGAIVAPPIVAALAIAWGWRAAFLLTGVIGFAWLGAWLLFYETPSGMRAAQEARDADAQGSRTALKQSRSSTPARGFWDSVGEVSASRQLWGLMATRLLATPVWWFYVFWLPDYLAKERAFSLLQIGLFGWIPYLTVDLGKLAGGSISDRLLARGSTPTFARKVVMIAGAACMASGVLVVNAGSAAAAIAWVSVATFGFGMWSANILALHADIFPARSMAAAIGLTGAAASLGGAAFTYAVGQMVDAYGYGPAFFVAGLGAPIACIALIYGVGRVTPLAAATGETR
jgi:MFS transporter, ACS family, hexuronate transporter